MSDNDPAVRDALIAAVDDRDGAFMEKYLAEAWRDPDDPNKILVRYTLPLLVTTTVQLSKILGRATWKAFGRKAAAFYKATEFHLKLKE